MEELKMFKKQEMIKNGVVSMLLGVLGFYLAFFEKKPFEVVLTSTLSNGKYNTVYAPFYWGSVVVVAGCLMLVFALGNLITLLLNMREYENVKLYLFVMVEQNYHKVLIAFLLFLLYMTTTEIFEELARIWTFLAHREWPVTKIYMCIRVIIVLFGIVMATEAIHTLLVREYDSKWLNPLAVLFGLICLIGMVATTYTNLWYLAEGIIAVLLYMGFTYLMARLEQRNEEKVQEMLMNSDIWKDLEL